MKSGTSRLVLKDVNGLSDCEFTGGVAFVVRPKNDDARYGHLQGLYDRLADVLEGRIVELSDPYLDGYESRDIWIRDWAPVPIKVDGHWHLLTAVYDPQYNRKDREARSEEYFARRRVGVLVEQLEIVKATASGWRTEFGNFVHNGSDKVIMTKVFLELNWSVPETRGDFEEITAEYVLKPLGADLLLIPYEEGDPIRHADRYCRFLTPEVLAVASYEHGPSQVFHDRLDDLIKDRWPDLEIVRIPCLYPNELPVSSSELRDLSAAGNYVNFYRNGRTILVPSYGKKKADEAALAVLRNLVPELEIVPIPSNKLAELGGVLNSIATTYPEEIVPDLVRRGGWV